MLPMNKECETMLYLKKANLEDAGKEYAFIHETPADENGFTNPYAHVREQEFLEKTLPMILGHEQGIGLPEGYVPETSFFLWNGEEIVGWFRLRHYLNDFLRQYHGHVGYCIGRAHRGKGYGAKGLALLLEQAWDIIPEEAVYLSVHKDNPASLKVQQQNGAVICREDEENYYTRIPRPNI